MEFSFIQSGTIPSIHIRILILIHHRLMPRNDPLLKFWSLETIGGLAGVEIFDDWELIFPINGPEGSHGSSDGLTDIHDHCFCAPYGMAVFKHGLGCYTLIAFGQEASGHGEILANLLVWIHHRISIALDLIPSIHIGHFQFAIIDLLDMDHDLILLLGAMLPIDRWLINIHINFTLMINRACLEDLDLSLIILFLHMVQINHHRTWTLANWQLGWRGVSIPIVNNIFFAPFKHPKLNFKFPAIIFLIRHASGHVLGSGIASSAILRQKIMLNMLSVIIVCITTFSVGA